VPQTDAIDQSTIKSGLGQGLTRLTRFFIYPDYPACLCVARRQVYPVKKWDFLYYLISPKLEWEITHVMIDELSIFIYLVAQKWATRINTIKIPKEELDNYYSKAKE